MLDQLRSTIALSGRPVGTLLAEWLRLRFGRGRIGLSEYLDFGLFRDDLSFAEKSAFGGWRAQRILEEILVDAYSRILTLDKVTAHLLLSGLGLPLPRLLAVFAGQRRPGPFDSLTDAGELAGFFGGLASGSVYLKPAFGVKGKGNLSVVGADSVGVETRKGDRIGYGDLARRLRTNSAFGWMIQEELIAHESLAERCGQRVSGLRLNVFLTRDGPRVVRATWKLNVGGDTDNFDRGRTGNLVAAVDVASGIVTRVVSGIGLDQREVDLHPVTGRALNGLQLPFWEESLRLVDGAARAFPGFLCQGWDIAISNRGPVILEVNDFGDLDLVQAAHGTGFLDEPFMAMLRDEGLEHLLTGPSRSWMRNARNGRLGRRASHWRW